MLMLLFFFFASKRKSMSSYIKTVEVRWSDLDPNFHLRHSVYYDFGAYCRVCFFIDHDLTPAVLTTNHLGPILLREECVFRRELHFGDKVSINLKLMKSNASFSRWTIQHEIIKNENTLSALITVDGAWMDTDKRKIIVPPEFVIPAFEKLPRAADFYWVDKK